MEDDRGKKKDEGRRRRERANEWIGSSGIGKMEEEQNRCAMQRTDEGNGREWKNQCSGH
jgi:hypothetical protein